MAWKFEQWGAGIHQGAIPLKLVEMMSAALNAYNLIKKHHKVFEDAEGRFNRFHFARRDGDISTDEYLILKRWYEEGWWD